MLLLLSLVFAITSCAQSIDETFDIDFTSDGNVYNLDGFTFTYGVIVTDDTVLGYLPDSLFADAVKVRLDEIEKKLNCTIKINHDSHTATLFASTMAGSFYCDAIMEGSNGIVSLMRSGILVGISTLSDYIDYTDTFKWGTKNMLEALFWQDDLYAVLPASWPELLYGNSGYPVLVNENLIATMGATDPREYVEDKSWTWDRLEEVLDLYTTELNGVKVYGMSVHPPYYGEMFMRSNGNRLVEVDDNGEYICGWYTESAKAAYSRGVDIMYVTHKNCFYPAWDNATTSQAFINGQAVLYPTWSFYVVGSEALSYQMDNLGLVPFPWGPNADPDVYPSVHEGLSYVIAIPYSSSDVEASAIVLNELYEPLPGYETEEDIVAYLSKYDFFDPRDAKVFLNMFQNTQYAFYEEGARIVSEALSDGDSLARGLEANEDIYESLFEEVIIPTQLGMEALWGK